jgi:mannose-6-phosphate isomerase-like protein (cupin superfamily)
MRMFAEPLGSEEVAFTYRRMPPDTGGKGSYGHSHPGQEEVYFVVSGKLTFKLGDDLVEADAGTAVRVAGPTPRSVHNESDSDAELVIVSTRSGPEGPETETHEGFWPA